MKNHIKMISAFLLLVLAGMFTRLQAQETLKLNLDKALEIALSENPTILIANKEIQRQKYVKDEAIGSFFPTISASGSYMYNALKPVMYMPSGMFPGLSGPIRMGYDNSVTLGATLSLPIVAPALAYNIQMANIDMDLVMENARKSRVDLIGEVRKAYYNVIMTIDSYKAVEQSYQIAQKTLDDVTRMYEQGLVSEYDMLTAQVQVSNLRPTVSNTQSLVELAKLTLKMLLSVPQHVNVELEDDIADFEDEVANAVINQEINLSNNTDLINMEYQEIKLRKQLDIYRTQCMPTLAFFINYQTQAQDNTLKFSQYQFANTLNLGLNLSIPIFSGLTHHFKIKQLKVGIEELSIQKDYMQEGIYVQAKNVMNNLLKAKDELAAAKDAVKQSQKAYDIATVSYNTGQGTILDLSTSENALLQSKLNYNRSIYNYLAAQADFEKIIGNELKK